MNPSEAWPASLHRVLEASPELAKELYLAASEIVDDFDDYGPVIQANDNGEYDETTAIQRLRSARDAILKRLPIAAKG